MSKSIRNKRDEELTKIKEIENYIDDSISNSNSIKELSIHFQTEVSNINLKLNSNDLPSAFKTEVFDNKIEKIYFSVSNNDVYVAKTNNVTFPDNDNFNNL